ncbi:MAG: polysaccharide biosynthesis tyrosine autokinase [Azospirillaceae bacterium]|nr:polysaccharide biosynthesis tyrosine autokinase [Azospirillaceae bacterium]
MTDYPSSPLAPLQAAADFGQTVRRAWRVIWRGKHLVFACVALIVIPTVLYLQQATRLYTAEASLMIEAPETNDVLTDRSVNATRDRLTEATVQTEADLISSAVLARRVIAKLNLDQDPEFNPKLQQPRPFDSFMATLNPLSWLPGNWSTPPTPAPLPADVRANLEQSRVIRAFESHLRVIPRRRSYIITVEYTSENAQKAAQIANAVAELYLTDRLEASFEDARQVSGWLGERLGALQKDVATAQEAVETFRSEHGLRRSEDHQTTVGDQQLSELNSRLIIARADLAQKQARLAQVEALGRNRGNLDTATDVLQSPLIQNLREQETTKARELSEAQKTYGDRHPRIIGLRADIAELDGKLKGEVVKIGQSIANDAEVSAAGVASLERELATLRHQTDVAGQVGVHLSELERQADASKSLYETFLTRFKREAEQEHMRRANARIVSPADIPIAPSSPRVGLIRMLAFVLSLVGGVSLVFLLESLDNAVRSADDAEALTGLPVLAMIPLLRNMARRPAAEILAQPRSALADGIRSLRTALDLGEGREGAGVILITSSVPKEGKTFVSLCLALLFSKVEDRVLLIDADTHRPRLHIALGVDGEHGLCQILQGSAKFDDVVQRNVAGNLDFLPAGRGVHLSEIIQGSPIDDLIADLSTRYTRIIMDSPPVLAVADTRLLARLADRIVYLVKWNATPRDAVRNGIKLLRAGGATLHGVALSQVNQRKHSRYGYGDYGQYYGRYHEYYGEGEH